MPVFGPTRAALAAAAARGADILPSLRLVLTAEALTAPPPPRALELNAELDMENNAEPQEAEKPSVLAKLKEPIPLYEPKQHQAKEACR